MGKNRYVQHKHINKENSKGDMIGVFYHKHYDSEGYAVVRINDQEVKPSVSWETLENAVKSTEK